MGLSTGIVVVRARICRPIRRLPNLLDSLPHDFGPSVYRIIESLLLKFIDWGFALEFSLAAAQTAPFLLQVLILAGCRGVAVADNVDYLNIMIPPEEKKGIQNKKTPNSDLPDRLLDARPWIVSQLRNRFDYRKVRW